LPPILSSRSSSSSSSPRFPSFLLHPPFSSALSVRDFFFFKVFFINLFKKENRPKDMAGVEEKDVSGVEEEKATPSTAPDAAAATAGGGEEEAGKHGDEEDTGAQIAPIVKLQEVSISTGEENEDVLLDM
jgi:hypothetical protein